jgi:hypothetical protein
MGQAVGIAGVVGGSGPDFHLEFHQPLRGKADHLAEKVGVGSLLQ